MLLGHRPGTCSNSEANHLFYIVTFILFAKFHLLGMATSNSNSLYYVLILMFVLYQNVDYLIKPLSISGAASE